MTLPAYQGVSAAGSETSVPWPAGHAAGHLGICVVEHHDGTVTTPSGWTVVPGFPILHEATSVRCSAFYKFAASGAESNFAITGSTDHNWGVIITFTGVNTLNPFHIVSGSTNVNGVNQFWPGITTLLQDCLILQTLAWAADSAGPLTSTGPTNADLGSLTGRYDAGTATSSGGGVLLATGTLANKMAISQTTMVLNTSSATCVATIALQSADQTFGVKSNIINLGKHRMAIPCKQSTAQDFRVFMANSADGKTGATGLTLSVFIQKQGDTSFSSISPTVTEIGNGHYNLALTTTHMNTVGLVSLRVTATGADPADCPNCIDVIAYDKTSTTRGTAGTALPAVAAEAAGGLYTRGSGAGQINQNANGQIDSNPVTWKGGTIPSPNVTGVPIVDTKYESGTVQPAPTVAGIPKVEDATLQGRLTSTRAGYLDNLSAGAVALASSLTSAAADITTLLGRLTSTRAGYLDNLSAGAVALASALSTAQTAITAIKAKTDSLTFTVANQVDANALTGGGGATASDVRDAILNYEYRTGRTLRGLFRRLGAALEKATGLKGTLVQYFQPDGTTVEFSVAQSVTNGTREVATVTNSETP